jgi:hypothetical protein
LLEDVRAGCAVQRRDAVRMARLVLESGPVRMAEAVLEAPDKELIMRLIELLEATIELTADHAATMKRIP